MLNAKARTPRDRCLRVALFLLLATVGVSLWEKWPRGDTKFVGEWTIAAEDEQPSAKVILRRNGSGYVCPKLDSDDGYLVHWKVEENALIIGYSSNWLTRSVNDLWDWLRPGYTPVLRPEKCYPILEMSDRSIRIADTWTTVTLRRVR